MIRKIKLLGRIIQFIIDDIKYDISFLKHYDREQEVIFSKLRTYAHVLDKGINMLPFEKGHGKKIYEKSKELKSNITNEQILNDKAFKWSCNVIENYEKKQVDDNEKEYENFNKYEISNEEKLTFYKVIRSRTSCRNYLSTKISNEIWNEILSIAVDAPSGCCRQASRYYVIEDERLINQLLKNIAGSSGFSTTIPYLVCVTSDTRSYGIQDRYLPIIDTSLSIENFLLACTANNIYTTPLNWEHATKHDEETVRNLINIPLYERIILFISAGYSNIVPIKPERVDLKWIRKM